MQLLSKYVIAPANALLRQGTDPKALAVSAAIGLVIGVFPVLGASTVLCTLIALRWRANLVVVHAIHYAATPLQLLLIIPFVRVGELSLAAPTEPLSISAGLALIESGIATAIHTLWSAIVHAVIGWSLIAPLAFIATYVAALAALKRIGPPRTRPTAETPVP